MAGAGPNPAGDEHRGHVTAGTLFLALLLAALVVPGVVVVAHDTLPHRLPWAQQHQQRD